MNDTDLQLLESYTRKNSQDAFAALVNRHLNLVFSAALRQVRSPQLAEEISQSVFSDLAQSATKLKPDTILTAWLYEVTRCTAIDVVRRESRRQLREKVAHELTAMNATADDWTHIEPFLDETDRAAVLLRYFENKSLCEVGETLGTSDDAAQKRVSRAVDRLREFFAKRGVTIGASGLVVVISANAVQAAPVGLAATISTATALAGTSIVGATLTKSIAMTTIQKALITATLAVVVGTGIYEARQAAQLRERNQMLQKLQTPLAEQFRQMQQERHDATNRLATLVAENSRLKSNSNQKELLKLRGEVARLRVLNAHNSENDSRESLVKSWLAREDQLKQTVQQFQNKSIPEFQLLSEQQWLDAAMDAKFDSDKGIQRTLADLRHTAENNFASQAHNALSKYMKANDGKFPTELSQLQPYFSSSVDEAILQRWEIAPASINPSVGVGDTIITTKAAVDESLDQRWAIGAHGFGAGNWESQDTIAALSSIKTIMKVYAADHNGNQPADPSQLLPYLTTPEQQAAYQTLLKKFPTNQSGR